MEAERERYTERPAEESVERKRKCLVQEQARLESESIFYQHKISNRKVPLKPKVTQKKFKEGYLTRAQEYQAKKHEKLSSLKKSVNYFPP